MEIKTNEKVYLPTQSSGLESPRYGDKVVLVEAVLLCGDDGRLYIEFEVMTCVCILSQTEMVKNSIGVIFEGTTDIVEIETRFLFSENSLPKNIESVQKPGMMFKTLTLPRNEP